MEFKKIKLYNSFVDILIVIQILLTFYLFIQRKKDLIIHYILYIYIYYNYRERNYISILFRKSCYIFLRI